LEVTAAEAKIDDARRRSNLKLAEAVTAFEVAKTVAANYEGDVLPKGESMLTAMREGYSAGIVTLVEVLEAQQAVARLRQERTQATLALRLAEIDRWNALLTLPGVEVPR
jgi:outer membrane protein TolC